MCKQERPRGKASASRDRAKNMKVRNLSFTGAGFAVIAVTFGLARYGYGLFVPEIGREFGLSQEWLGLIGSASYAGYLATTAVSLWLSGVLGPRALIAAGAACATAGTALVGLASGTEGLTLGIILAGASPGFVFAPISDAVTQVVAVQRQNRSWAIINSGNGAGVLIAGLVALGAGPDWRGAWLAFAGLAAAAAVWNAWAMPSVYAGSAKAPLPALRVSWFLRPAACPLFAFSFLAGIVTTVYWTFSTSLIEASGGSRQLAPESLRSVFWALLGAGGIAGAAAGDLITRYGLRRTLRATCLGMAASIGLTALMPHEPAVLAASALVFGATFILVTGEIGVWSVHIFKSRPSAGFGATFLLFALGGLAGPALAGAFAEAVGLVAVFHGIMIGAGIMAFLKPRLEIWSMTG